MNIEATSTVLNLAKVQQAVGVSLLKDVLNLAGTQMDQLMEMAEVTRVEMERSIQPHLGGNIDMLL